ncbi:hypothetical protein ACOSQ4_004231 [Xanthoceras sorbifolium]
MQRLQTCMLRCKDTIGIILANNFAHSHELSKYILLFNYLRGMHMIRYSTTIKTKIRKKSKVGVRGVVQPKSSKRRAYEESLGFQPIYTNKTNNKTLKTNTPPNLTQTLSAMFKIQIKRNKSDKHERNVAVKQYHFTAVDGLPL